MDIAVKSNHSPPAAPGPRRRIPPGILGRGGGMPRPALPVLLPVLAMTALYAPTVATLATGYWDKEDGSYSPLVFAAALAMALHDPPRRADASASAIVAGTGLLGAGLLCLLAGRLLGNITIEFGSALLVAPGFLIALAGWRAAWSQIYPLATLAIAVPLPGSIVVSLTFPLKMAVSGAAEQALRLIGVPIAREGIMLDIGDYRLLVVDACSGLQSLFSLFAAALIYLALAGRRSTTSAATLLLAILPIAFAANVIRVVALALITYLFGDRAGQGFLHGFAGMFMFVCAFAGLMVVDAVTGRIAGRRTARQ